MVFTTVVTLCVGRVEAFASTVVTARAITAPPPVGGSQTRQIPTQRSTTARGIRTIGTRWAPVQVAIRAMSAQL